MTVHGAKGLEANIVILADTTTPPGGPRDPRLLTLDNGASGLGGPRAANDVDAMSDARAHGAAGGARRIPPPAVRGDDARRRAAGGLRHARQEQNSRRLLVSTGRRTRCADECVSEPADDGGGEVLRYRKGGQRAGRKFRRTSCRPRSSPTSVPSWLDTDASVRHLSAARHHAVERRGRRRPRARLPPRPTRNALAARHAWCTGCCSRCRIFPPTAAQGGRRITSPEPAPELAADEREKIAEQVMLVLDDPRLLRAVLRPAAGPKCRSSAGLKSAEKSGACPARSTAWR